MGQPLNIEAVVIPSPFSTAPVKKTEEVIAENPGKKLVPYYTVKSLRLNPLERAN